MHSQSIKDLLDLPALNICSIQKEQDQIIIEVTTIDATQLCPICASTQTIRRGIAYQRKVRYLAAFGKRVYLLLSAIRLTCKDCQAHFVWTYDCVAPKKRYTKAFEATLPKQVIRATMTHAARLSETPLTKRFTVLCVNG
ncbi:transposase family protein [Kurthia gibsonii]|uniref:Transposase family protein n=1 Tax=Kurthia gibsonii TaxID=33946 RepID=A0ABU9LJU0_9BACL